MIFDSIDLAKNHDDLMSIWNSNSGLQNERIIQILFEQTQNANQKRHRKRNR